MINDIREYIKKERENLFLRIQGSGDVELDRQIAFCQDAILQGDSLRALECCIDSLAWYFTQTNHEPLYIAKKRIKKELQEAIKLDPTFNETELLVKCIHCDKIVNL